MLTNQELTNDQKIKIANYLAWRGISNEDAMRFLSPDFSRQEKENLLSRGGIPPHVRSGLLKNSFNPFKQWLNYSDADAYGLIFNQPAESIPIPQKTQAQIKREEKAISDTALNERIRHLVMNSPGASQPGIIQPQTISTVPRPSQTQSTPYYGEPLTQRELHTLTRHAIGNYTSPFGQINVDPTSGNLRIIRNEGPIQTADTQQERPIFDTPHPNTPIHQPQFQHPPNTFQGIAEQHHAHLSQPQVIGYNPSGATVTPVIRPPVSNAPPEAYLPETVETRQLRAEGIISPEEIVRAPSFNSPNISGLPTQGRQTLPPWLINAPQQQPSQAPQQNLGPASIPGLQQRPYYLNDPTYRHAYESLMGPFENMRNQLQQGAGESNLRYVSRPRPRDRVGNVMKHLNEGMYSGTDFDMTPYYNAPWMRRGL